MQLLITKIEWLVEVLGGLARFCVLTLVLLVATNVLLRYAFSIGSVSMQELEWHLISPIALLGLAYSMKHKTDVRVDFIYEKLSRAQRALVDCIGSTLTLMVGLIIVWLSIPYVAQSFLFMEGSPDPGGLPWRFLLKSFIPIGFGLLALQALADALRALEELINPAVNFELNGVT